MIALVVSGALIIAGLMIYQAAYVIRKGQMMPFIAGMKHRPMGLPRRILYAAIYAFPALGIVTILATSLRRAGLDALKNWGARNGGLFGTALFLLILGLLHVWRPANMLRWMLRTNPDLAEVRAMRVTARMIGLGLFLIALFILARL